MSSLKYLIPAAVAACLLCAPDAEADIYKCEAEDGSVSYSQIPCPEKKSETVSQPRSRADDVTDCRWASQFANDVARRMRSGLASGEVFDLYGGIDSVSKGTVNIINYVYRFRSDNSIANERISSLAGNMCKAGSLGDVRCESLPYGQDPTGQRCNPDADAPQSAATGATAVPTAGNFTASTSAPSSATNRTSPAENARAAARSEDCRDHYRDQIDAIDAEMRRGYDSAQGEQYRERLRSLTSRMREC